MLAPGTETRHPVLQAELEPVVIRQIKQPTRVSSGKTEDELPLGRPSPRWPGGAEDLTVRQLRTRKTTKTGNATSERHTTDDLLLPWLRGPVEVSFGISLLELADEQHCPAAEDAVRLD